LIGKKHAILAGFFCLKKLKNRKKIKIFVRFTNIVFIVKNLTS